MSKIDEYVNECTSTYSAKIKEYIEDLKNKRGNIDMDNGMEVMLEGAEDDQIIDASKYLDKYKKMVNVNAEIPEDIQAKKKDTIFFDDSSI